MDRTYFGSLFLFNQDQINGLQLPSGSTVEIPLQDSSTFTLYFPPEYSVPGVLDLAPHIHLKSMAFVRFRTSTFRNIKLKILLSSFPLEISIQSSRSDDMCPLSDRRLPATLVVGALGISNSYPSCSPGVFSPLVHNLSHVLSRSDQSRFSLGLQVAFTEGQRISTMCPFRSDG
jgi:hypothetical protein